jgi:hypothetical protein
VGAGVALVPSATTRATMAERVRMNCPFWGEVMHNSLAASRAARADRGPSWH